MATGVSNGAVLVTVCEITSLRSADIHVAQRHAWQEAGTLMQDRQPPVRRKAGKSGSRHQCCCAYYLLVLKAYVLVVTGNQVQRQALVPERPMMLPPIHGSTGHEKIAAYAVKTPQWYLRFGHPRESGGQWRSDGPWLSQITRRSRKNSAPIRERLNEPVTMQLPGGQMPAPLRARKVNPNIAEPEE